MDKNTPIDTLSSLSWFQCQLTLMPIFTNHKAHPLSIAEAIVKGITEQAQLQEKIKLTFKLGSQHSNRMRIRANTPVIITIDAFTSSQAVLLAWREVALHYFIAPNPGKNFTLLNLSEWQSQSIGELPQLNDHHGEVCLDFSTPLPFKPSKGKSRYWLDAATFSQLLHKRVKHFFDMDLLLPTASLTLLPYYWEYQQISHASHSQSGNVKYINGCIGKLYLRGDNQSLNDWLPWLVLASMIGIGTELSFGRGRCQLLLDSPTYFHATLINPSAVAHTLSEVLERYDQALPLLANTSTGLDETKWSIDLVAQLQQGITPQAFTAFKIPKANGKFRLVEKPTLPDLVVLFHLYAQLRDLLDRSFEEESIGFRKGMSRKLALERIQQGIDEGFDVVFESDISDFFPSVDHDILLKKLDALIPKNDVLLKTLLARYLKAPQKIDGQELARNKGLPMGSPLSPLLANVFLDAFDKHIKGFGVKLIRYADDFVILTRGKEVAEALLDDTQDFLHEMALSINLDKTAIRFIDEGFTFLGIHFGQDGEQTLNLSPAADSVRKPLYITEPFTYIGIDGDALEVRKSNTILSRIPLKRVSEVLTLAPASWSSALVAKCTEAGVPIVITSGNGRAIATFAGDSARHYDIAYRQGCYFHAMSETDRLNIAISLAQAKLENSIYFVKQRYRTGTNKVIQKLQSYHDQMASAQDADTVRGYEGAAAKLYFSLLNEWIVKPGFEWKGRNRRPADRINSLLNFGYHLLFSRLNVLLRGEGLNPYLSFLHEPTERYESFVSDIQEVFRVHIDRLVVRLINNSMISATDFVENEAGAWLSAKGKEVFLSAFSRELAHRPSSNRLSLNESMALQVHNWVEFLTEQKTLQLYHLVETKEHS